MQKFLALLVLAGVALALPNPNSVPRRCSRYTLYDSFEAKCLIEDEWYVVASTAFGSIFSWETEFQECDAFFTYGGECCGQCTSLRFLPSTRYTQYSAYSMVQYSFNDCVQDYNIVENFFGQAYPDCGSVYRSFSRENFDRRWLSYREVMDSSFISYNDFSSDFGYSIGILGYCPKNKVIIFAICNTFEYYESQPTIIVLATVPRLNQQQKLWVKDTLKANSICPYNLVFRNNFQCKNRCDYKPNIFY